MYEFGGLRAGLPLPRGAVRVSYDSRSLEISEELLDDSRRNPRTLSVSEDTEAPEIVRLSVSDRAGVLADIRVDVGVLRGFLTWLRDGDADVS